MIIHKDIGIDEIGVYSTRIFFKKVRPGDIIYYSRYTGTIPPEKIELAIKMFGLSRDQVFMELDLLARGIIKDYSKYTEIRNVSGSY